MSRDKQNIKTTDWLIRGIPEEQLKREKREAIMSAYLELCITYDEETKGIDFDATAEKMVAEGYVRSFDVIEEIFAEIEKEIELALDSNYKVKRDAQDDNDSLVMYVEGKIDCLRGLLGFLAELKKKHTEGRK